jgi:hypothetical protein
MRPETSPNQRKERTRINADQRGKIRIHPGEIRARGRNRDDFAERFPQNPRLSASNFKRFRKRTLPGGT